MPIKVKKQNNKLEDFDEQKVRNSLKRVGAKPEIINRILVSLTSRLYNGITTKAIYQHVFQKLNQFQAGLEHRYSLKNSLLGLGPSGYPFENFIARLLKSAGYQTQIPQILTGQCISHEVDVIAQTQTQKILIECKFHNKPGIKTRSKEAMYTYARFLDLKDQFDKVWLITNTKLTQNAIRYGNCQNMLLTAWHYPQKGSLEELIEQNNLHPLTCMSFLSPNDRQMLYNQNLVLCQDLAKLNSKQLQNLGLNSQKTRQIKQALTGLYHYQPNQTSKTSFF